MYRVNREDEAELRATHGLTYLDDLEHLDEIEDEYSPEEIMEWSKPDERFLTSILDPLGFLYEHDGNG